jgi:4-amino-4-deoxychorismate lyase
LLECLLNGEIATQIPVNDRSLHYGDGLFETMAVFRGQTRFWQSHMDRLAAGCERLKLAVPAQSVLLREVQNVSAGQQKCVVKIIITRGNSGRGYAPDSSGTTRRIVCSYPWPDDPGHLDRIGIRARICKLRLAVQPALAGIKHLNRLEQVMARAEWNDHSIHEGILLDSQDNVVSAISSNLFLVTGDRLLTPRLDRCGVRGVMRANILKAFKSRCDQRRITLDMLPEAEEIFVCNAVRGLFPVIRIDHWEYAIGSVTREVQQWLAEHSIA